MTSKDVYTIILRTDKYINFCDKRGFVDKMCLSLVLKLGTLSGIIHWDTVITEVFKTGIWRQKRSEL